jgi:hypothetical protein
MKIEEIALIISLAINVGMLILFIVQTKYLSIQTEALRKSIVYSSYQKLNDYINDINLLLLDHKTVVEIFKQMYSMKLRLKKNKSLSVEKVALAWHMLNRYEAAFTGYKLGVIPRSEWEVWKKRMETDVRLPFLHKVWKQDLTAWSYNIEFKHLVDNLLFTEKRPNID